MRTLRYPIGIQDFAKIREGGYVYVDKTEAIHRLVRSGSYFFLSRPRRFGKSLLLSTIEYMYSGRKELFKGLAIASLPWKWDKHPVLHLDLNVRTYDSAESVHSILSRHLSEWEEQYRVKKTTDIVEDRFINVIREAHMRSKRKTVILVDEYDKPLFSTLENKGLHELYRGQLQTFYSVLKSMDRHIEFAMFTGVTRFSKVSIFSGLNNLTDISLETGYADICGITQAEAERYFGEAMDGFATSNALSVEEGEQELRRNYYGYRFSAAEQQVYNPFSLMSALRTGTIDNFWFETGTPTFLARLLRNSNYNLNNLERERRSSNALKGSDEELRDFVSIFYQTGYLTITGYDKEFKEYRLGYPNKEVEESLLRFLVPYYSPEVQSDTSVTVLVKALQEGKVEQFMRVLGAFFADFPYEQIPNLELHYQNVVYILLKLIGMHVRMECHTSQGRIDMVIETRRIVYIIEFKLGHSPEDAIRQIMEKQYALPYAAGNREIIGIGINFDRRSRAIHSWQSLPLTGCI